MDSFPAYFPLAGHKVVIAGSGPAAEAKARLFESAPAMLVRLEDHRAWLPGSYVGAVVAFVASDDDLFVQAAANAARAARVLVNVVDRPDLSDFITPAVIDRGEVVAAVGTGGAAPVLATMLRNDIEAQLPEGSGRVAALLRHMQGELREALPQLHERRAFLREAINGPAAQAAIEGDMDRARALLREAIESAEPAPGRVRFVAGRGPSDLLTIRASRALASCDVLVPDADADPGVLGLVRRDAERMDPAEADLEALAKQGLQVVRLITAAPDAEALRELVRTGVVVEVLLAAPS
jgi:siroheme synthase-like protein